MSIEMMGNRVEDEQPVKKNFLKKLRKSFGGSEKVLTFASAFAKKAHKEEFFERFRYKQASSTKAYLGKKTETVNNLNKLKIDLVLEQIKTITAM